MTLSQLIIIIIYFLVAGGLVIYVFGGLVMCALNVIRVGMEENLKEKQIKHNWTNRQFFLYTWFVIIRRVFLIVVLGVLLAYLYTWGNSIVLW